MRMYAVCGFVPEVVHIGKEETSLRLYADSVLLGGIFVPNRCLDKVIHRFIMGSDFLGEMVGEFFRPALPEDTLISYIESSDSIIGQNSDTDIITYTPEEFIELLDTLRREEDEPTNEAPSQPRITSNIRFELPQAWATSANQVTYTEPEEEDVNNHR